jgi:hypothetical protein
MERRFHLIAVVVVAAAVVRFGSLLVKEYACNAITARRHVTLRDVTWKN